LSSRVARVVAHKIQPLHLVVAAQVDLEPAQVFP
jgi:hypothetical protein